MAWRFQLTRRCGGTLSNLRGQGTKMIFVIKVGANK